MGRYYETNTGRRGKFMFGVQSSDDPGYMGMNEQDRSYIDYYADRDDEQKIRNKLDEQYDILGMPKGKRLYTYKEEKEYDERYHPDKYTWVLNTGKKQTIDAGVFDALADEWGDIEYIDTHYSNCIDGGGIETSEWNGHENDTWTVTYTHRYRNPFKHSNSLFKVRKHYSEYEAEKNGLFKYPEITGYYQDAIVFRDDDIVSKYHSVEAEDEFQKINAFDGYEKEIHVFVLLYDSDKYNKEVSFKQRDYWNGLNKNELVICIGADDKKAQWCNVLSWSDSVEWLRSVEKKVLSMDELDLYEFSKWLRMSLDGWVRKEFKDFSYLKI